MRNFEKLEELINHHNDLYFNKNAPEISDFEFDLLVEELKNINPKAKFFSSVGVPNKSNKIQHKEPMLSLDKCYSEKSLFKWLEKSKLGVIGMPKIDGVACSLRYNLRGVLELAVTRGDGKFGENITPNVRVIKEIPNQISTTQKLEIRGEVYLT